MQQYLLVTGYNENFQARVKELLEEGWELYGNVVISEEKRIPMWYCREMVKREPSDYEKQMLKTAGLGIQQDENIVHSG